MDIQGGSLGSGSRSDPKVYHAFFNRKEKDFSKNYQL
jgi:hypothetical protein